jgi:CubicO group peptidase (beta-lactamase class C family)
MTKIFFSTLLIITLATSATLKSQSIKAFADSIRTACTIPELGYAILSSDKIYEMQVTGVKKINSTLNASLTDKFRIGSNTKAITGFIAALLVKQKKISWDTKFFDLYPELKPASDSAYYNLTLLNLLTFRTKLFPYSYYHSEPKKEQFSGNEEQQRYQFTSWFFQQKPYVTSDSVNFSNLGYVAAGLMLEKVSGKPYKQLVADLGAQLGITFGFGPPNATDSLQPWGHNSELKPEPPGENYKLSWLLPAGNINVSLPDYSKFIQLQLQGLLGKSTLLTKEEFYFLHYGLAEAAVGWFWNINEHKQIYSFHTGNPGTFYTRVYVFKDTDKAFIMFSNAQTENTIKAFDSLFNKLNGKYNN